MISQYSPLDEEQNYELNMCHKMQRLPILTQSFF